ncbi:MAG: hypothetical protein ACE361_20070 [Aureliella sp.]
MDHRLDEVVFRTLENEPENRYQQASEVSVDVASISGGQTPTSIDKAPSASESSKSMSNDNNSLFWIAAFAVIATSVVLPAFLGKPREPLIAFVQWAFSSGSILFAGLGILQILAPARFWFFSRQILRSSGVSTDQNPGHDALRVIRIRGALMLAFALSAFLFVQILLGQFLDGLQEFDELVTNQMT